MTDPKIVARDLAIWASGGVSEFNGDGQEVMNTWAEHFEKALTSERTTAYKAGMEMAAEIAENFPVDDGCDDELVKGFDIAMTIRTEANKEIK